MKKGLLWKLLLLAGACPFLVPAVWGILTVSQSTMGFGEWLLLYSFLYWPTYLFGPVLLGLGLWLRCRRGKK